jgi:allantoate deiminase
MSIGETALARCAAWRHPPFSETPQGLTRRYLTLAHRAALDQLADWMRAACMDVRLDAAGTLIGRYEGTGSKTVLIGSHIDTVGDAGAYDGVLGVMLGLGCIEALAASGERLPFAIELLAFGDEEGSRFHASMLGSRALAGKLPDALPEMVDAEGVSLEEALRGFGLDVARMPEAMRARADVLLYLEPHIEQGPVLEAEDLPVGIVTGIAAQTRLKVTLRGVANHAGTTPMNLRRDALAAAAEAMLALEHIAAGAGIVGTVGTIEAHPGLSNVVPGRAVFSVDLRAPTAEARDTAERDFARRLDEIAARRGIAVEMQVVQRLAPCFCDAQAQAVLAEAVAAQSVRPFYLPSGAGHDAMSVAALCKVAMLFIRCRAGISHNPAEHVEAADAETAAQVILGFLRRVGEKEAAAF